MGASLAKFDPFCNLCREISTVTYRRIIFKNECLQLNFHYQVCTNRDRDGGLKEIP